MSPVCFAPGCALRNESRRVSNFFTTPFTLNIILLRCMLAPKLGLQKNLILQPLQPLRRKMSLRYS